MYFSQSIPKCFELKARNVKVSKELLRYADISILRCLSSIIKLYIWKHCYCTCCIRDEHPIVKTVWQILFVHLDDEDEILLYRYFDGHFGDTYIRMFFMIKLKIIFETYTIICVVQLYSSVNGTYFQHSPYHPFPVGPHK